MSSFLTGLFQTLLFLTSFISLYYITVDFSYLLLFLSVVIFKVTQTFGSGITLHMWASHGLYKPKGVIKLLSLICVILAGVNKPSFYSKYHTIHHKFVDTDKDPHSPKYFSAINLIMGLWVLTAHKYDKHLTDTNYMKEIDGCSSLKFIDNNFYLIIFSLITISFILSPVYASYFLLLPILLNNLDGNYFFIYLFHKNGILRNVKILNYWILGNGGDHATHHRFFKR